MAYPDSTINPAARFFNYRWAYITLFCVLWFNLFLMLVGDNQVALFAPAYLIWNVFSGQIPEIAELSVQSIFGFDFGFGTPIVPGFIVLLLLIGCVACLIVPEFGKVNRMPAMHGLHVRAKLIVSLIAGLSSTAFIAGVLDALNIDMVQVFLKLGMLKVQNHSGFIYAPDSFRPKSGIISLISLGSTALGVSAFGGITFVYMCLAKLGRDRYWQVERWTLLLTLFGIALVLLSLPFIEWDNSAYQRHYIFLGGCYCSWLIGWITLTFAWTCRSILLMMMQQYEKAALESDEPNCFACGYDLRMLTSNQCPECGTTITEKRFEKIKKRTEHATATTHAESRSTTR
jgi:predicted RNA-binding Zn-ribbon protein involved in translation (DUF1610 family)